MAVFLWALIITIIGLNMCPLPTIFGLCVGLGCWYFQYEKDREIGLRNEIEIEKLRAKHAVKQVDDNINRIKFNECMILCYKKDLESQNISDWKKKDLTERITRHREIADVDIKTLNEKYYPKLEKQKEHLEQDEYQKILDKCKPYLEKDNQQGN